MGSFPSANPSLPTSIPGIYEPPSAVVGTVPIASGGTGQTTAAAALAALGGALKGSHTLKRGSASGNYSITGTTLASFDATSFLVTVTVPLNVVALAFFWMSISQVVGATGEFGTAIDGTVQSSLFLSGSVSNNNLVPAVNPAAVLVGDGASHTFEPYARVTNAADAMTIINNAALESPVFLVLLLGMA